MKKLFHPDSPALEKKVEPGTTDISISVVSHAQITLVAELLRGLEAHCRDSRFELILTLNRDETLPFALDSFSYPIKLLRNGSHKGFGANQNQAFSHASGRNFCVINPDIRLASNPFPALLSSLDNSSVGVVAPLVMNENGQLEDSARRFPTPFRILGKLFGRGWGPDYVVDAAPVCPDWVGGMFMLFPRHVFERLGGFDEGYFLYYEDVDICARLRLRGQEARLCPGACVVHQAQRHSHRNFRYLAWHLRSMLRFFLSSVYWQTRHR
ncbi:MAG: glycosyltransferase [Rhodoferax sp.]|uniref:glycosyltransferase n=1 Tax=Rhodoferax sp. TaxID=50421 RepID=UPI00260AFD26|nr:glycosyltransferase [Rhodoferax sp.]MDD5333369.1 glycosyltransferase [Rhodoferax sp.]